MCTTRSVFLTIHRFEKFLDGVDDASSDTDSVLCFLNSTIGDLAEVMHGISGELHRDYESTLWLCNASSLMSSPQTDKEMEVQPAHSDGSLCRAGTSPEGIGTPESECGSLGCVMCRCGLCAQSVACYQVCTEQGSALSRVFRSAGRRF